MRILLGLVSFSAAGLLLLWLVPVLQQVVIPYVRQGPGVPFSLVQFGPIHFYEGHICIMAALIALVVVMLVVAGIRALTWRDKTPEPYNGD